MEDKIMPGGSDSDVSGVVPKRVTIQPYADVCMLLDLTDLHTAQIASLQEEIKNIKEDIHRIEEIIEGHYGH